jgi:hypothetical protein
VWADEDLSGFSNKFLNITRVSLEFASSIILGEGPVDRLAVAMAFVSPRQHCPIEDVERRNASIETWLR